MPMLPNAGAWIVRPGPISGARQRLFCFPYAGGGASAFRTWPDLLPPTVEVCAVQPPGRENRLQEKAFVAFPPLLDALLEALTPYLDRPFAFFGHSLGALVAFEIARRLRGRPDPGLTHLFVSGKVAPTLPNPSPPLYNLPEPDFLHELQRIGGTPQEVLENEELMSFLLPLLRADFMLNDCYAFTPGVPLDVPLTALGGLQDHRVAPHHLEAWQQQTTGPFRMLLFPGGHFYLNSARNPLLQVVAEELRKRLPEPQS